MKIYTKTGDRGTTSLLDGTRVSKNHIRVVSYGEIDELNAVIGIVVSDLSGTEFYKQQMVETLIFIEQDLFEIEAQLSNPVVTENQQLTQQLQTHIIRLEEYIDELTEQLPVLSNFILPGGGHAGATLHLARTVSRRVERQLVALMKDIPVDPLIVSYLNRLSDVFFTMSRFVNFKEGKEEIIWTSNVG